MTTRGVTIAFASMAALSGCAGERPAPTEFPLHGREVIELVQPPIRQAPDVPATKSATIAIHVVDSGDGHPLGGARVRLLPPRLHSEMMPFIVGLQRPARQSEAVVLTDATGTVVVGRDAYEGSDLLVEVDGYVAAEPEDRAGDHTSELIARLRLASAVEGRVVDAATGAGIADARVTARKYFEMYDGILRLECGSATADGNGVFRVTTLCPGEHVWLQATVEGKASSVTEVWSGLAKRTEHAADLRVATPAAVAGRVVDADGKPAADAKVIVTAGSVEHVHEFARLVPFPFRWTIDELAEGRTAADGTYRVDGLAKGERFTVYALAEDPVAYAVGVATAGGEVPDLVLARFPRVFVRLLGEGGTPVEKGWRVTSYLDGQGAYESTTGDDGWAEVAPELRGVGLGVRWIDLLTGRYGRAKLRVVTRPGEDLRIETTLKR